MAATSTDVCNEALDLMGDDGPPVTGTAPNFDSSTAGQVAAKIYAPAVAAVARHLNVGFQRAVISLALTGNAAPFPWAYEYAYPANCVKLLTLAPPTASNPDLNNPMPLDRAIGNNLVGGVQSRVVWANQAQAQAVFNSNPQESTWDSDFRQAVVNLLAAKFAMALAGKPDMAAQYMEIAAQFSGLAIESDE